MLRVHSAHRTGFASSLSLLSVLGALLGAFPAIAGDAVTAVPPPQVDERKDAPSETAVLAGGCFWGVQAVFQHVKGVRKAVSGYAGGTKESANYDRVSSGRTSHAESVEITFDPRVVSYGTILQVFFSVAHDPTQLNRQGPDVGPQYRSAIFTQDAAQRRIAELRARGFEAQVRAPQGATPQSWVDVEAAAGYGFAAAQARIGAAGVRPLDCAALR